MVIMVTGRNTSGQRTAARRQAIDRVQVAQINARQAFAERKSSQNAAMQRAAIQASAQTAAASMQASQATTQSQRLLVEFQAGLAQRQALQQRQTDKAVGQAAAGFASSGVQSIGAQQDAKRESAIAGNIGASEGNTRREQILGQARSAITSAIATGTVAGGSLAASAVHGKFEERRVSNKLGAIGEAEWITQLIGRHGVKTIAAR